MDPSFVLFYADRGSGRLWQQLSPLAMPMDPLVLRDPSSLSGCSGSRILFAVQLNKAGLSAGFTALLSWLRTHPGRLQGCTAVFAVDSPNEFYSKAAGRELALAANQAGCILPGHSLVEATGSLANFAQRARNADTDLIGAYRMALQGLMRNLLDWQPVFCEHPRLVVIHASTRSVSNTLDLWTSLKTRLPGAEFSEFCLRNGMLADCAGCSYPTCLHFGEQGSCFYGGVMVDEVYPALRSANALVMLCPNYNDALSANLTAFINRLTALFRTGSFTDKQLFALVVSGYSGGDIVSRQIVSALSMNKGFILPPDFALMVTANDRGSAMRLPGIQKQLDGYAARMRRSLGLKEGLHA